MAEAPPNAGSEQPMRGQAIQRSAPGSGTPAYQWLQVVSGGSLELYVTLLQPRWVGVVPVQSR